MRQRRTQLVLLLFALATAPLLAQTNACANFDVGINGDLHGFRPVGPYSVDVSAMPVDSNNAAFISEMTASRGNVHVDFAGAGPYFGSGIPYNVVDSSVTPLVPVKNMLYPDDSDIVMWPIPATFAQEDYPPADLIDCSPRSYNPLTSPLGQDYHLITVDKNKCVALEAWQFMTCKGRYFASNTSFFDLTKNMQRPLGLTSADAAGMSLFEGLIRYDSTVLHPVIESLPDGTTGPTMGQGSRVTFQNIPWAGTGGDRTTGFYPPASHGAATGGGSTAYEGVRMRLKANYDVSRFTGAARTIVNSWKKYGVINADAGGTGFVSGTSDASWDEDNLQTLESIPLSAFEKVQSPPLLVSGTYVPSGSPAGATIFPTGPAPTLSTPAVSASILIEGQPATWTWTSSDSTGLGYDYVQNGVPARNGTATFTPPYSGNYPVMSCNQYGCTASAPIPVTVLPIPYKGVTGVWGPR